MSHEQSRTPAGPQSMTPIEPQSTMPIEPQSAMPIEPQSAMPAEPVAPARQRPPAPAPLPATRQLYWLLRRELWENRGIYFGPLFMAAIVIAAFALFASNIPEAVRSISALDVGRQRALFGTPFDIGAAVLVGCMFMAGAAYSGMALHPERSDRSILFWKSLPVSDRITIASKALVPLAVLPVITFALILLAQLVMVVIGSAVLAANGQDIAPVWGQLSLLRKTAVLVYALAAFSLWHAPVYALLILASGFGRRAGFVTIVLPGLAIVILEKFAFGTDYFFSMIKYRITGVFDEAFVLPANPQASGPGLTTLTDAMPAPMHFIATPGLWIGLAAAAALLAAAVQARRRHGPL